MISIDERERDFIKWIRAETELVEGKDFIVETREIGDVCVSERTVIEIKRVKNTPGSWLPHMKYGDYNDLWASVLDGRIYTQAKNRFENFEVNFVILEIEEGADMFHKTLTPKTFDEIMITLATSFHSVILYSSTNAETLALIQSIAEKDVEMKYVSPINPRPKPKSLKDKQINFLAGLDNVSDKKSNLLLEEVGSPLEILQWILDIDIQYTKSGRPKLPKGGLQVKGFGPKFFLENQTMLITNTIGEEPNEA